MRVSDTATLTYGVAGDDGTVAVESIPIYRIGTDGKAQLFLLTTLTATFEVGKEIACKVIVIGFLGSGRQGCMPDSKEHRSY